MSASDLKRRLARLERDSPAELLLVPQYAGMNEADAFNLRFGDASPPRGAKIVLIVNCPGDPDRPEYWER